MRPIFFADKNRTIHGKKKWKIVQAVAQPYGRNRTVLPFIKRFEHVHRSPLVMVSHDMEEPSLGPPKTCPLNGLKKPFVSGPGEHEGFTVFTGHGRHRLVLRKAGQRSDLFRRHVAETGSGRSEAISEFDELPADLLVRHAEGYEPISVAQFTVHAEREIAFGNAYPAAVFNNKRMSIAQPFPVERKFGPGLA